MPCARPGIRILDTCRVACIAQRLADSMRLWNVAGHALRASRAADFHGC